MNGLNQSRHEQQNIRIFLHFQRFFFVFWVIVLLTYVTMFQRTFPYTALKNCQLSIAIFQKLQLMLHIKETKLGDCHQFTPSHHENAGSYKRLSGGSIPVDSSTRRLSRILQLCLPWDLQLPGQHQSGLLWPPLPQSAHPEVPPVVGPGTPRDGSRWG